MHTSHHRFESVYVGSSAGPARSSAAGVLVCVAGRLLVSGRDSSEASRRREGIRKWWRGTESNCRHYDFQSYALPTELPRHVENWRSGRTEIIARSSPPYQPRHHFQRRPSTSYYFVASSL